MAQKQLDIAVVLNGKVDNSVSQLGQAIMNIGKAAMTVSAPLIQYGKESLEVYGNYEQNMKDAEAALSSTYKNSGELAGVMENLDTAAQDWAASTKFNTEDVSLAISEAAHAGMSYEEIMSTMPQAMLLAQAGGLDLSTALDYVIKSTNALGLDMDNLGTFIDEWAMGANSSATSIDEFGEAMLRMGSTMQFAGTTEDMFTMLAVLANMGTTGASAGTLLRNAMLRILAPTDKASEMMGQLGDVTEEEMAELDADSEALSEANEQLTELGFSAYDSQGKLKPMTQIFKELNKATEKLTEQDRNKLLSTIFGTRGLTAAMNLMQAASDDYGGLMEQIENSEGYAEKVSDIQMDSLLGSTAIFESKLEELKRHVGEVLAPQVEWGQTFIGQFVDKLNALDDGQFQVLVGAFEGLAATGPALLLVGGSLLAISKLFTPLGLTAVAALAVGGALGGLAAYKDMTFTENFGTMALDLDSLKASIDGLTTDDETAFAGLRDYITKLDGLATQYQEAATKLSSEITLDTLTGKVLTPEEQSAVLKYGQDIGTTLQQGIASARNLSLGTLNQAFSEEDLTNPETYSEYSGLYDLLSGFYGDLQSQATTIGQQLNDAILTAFEDDGRIDQVEQEKIRQYQEAMNNIQAQIMAMENAEEYSRMLERSQSVSWETMETYISDLSENAEARVDNMNDYYYRAMGQTRAALDADRKEAGLNPLTDEEWHNTAEYRSWEGQREESITPIQQQTAQLANTALNTLFSQSGYGEAWRALQGIYSHAATDENGNMMPNAITPETIASYVHSAQELQDVVSLSNILSDRKMLSQMTGLGEDAFGSLMSVWSETPEMRSAYNAMTQIGALTSMFPSIFGTQGSAGMFAPWMGYEYNEEAYQKAYENLPQPTITETETPTYAPQIPAPSSEGVGGITIPVTAEVEDVETPEDTTIEGTMNVTEVNAPSSEGVGGITSTLTTENAAEAGATAVSEAQAAIDAAGDLTAQADVPNASQAGSEAHSEVQGALDAAGPVNVTARVSNAWSLPGEIQSAIGSRTYTIQVRANVTGMPGASARGFATGGRADEPSIFGEAGPEWAIPEEHSRRTASLIDAVRQASGFSWEELASDAPSSKGVQGVFQKASPAGKLIAAYAPSSEGEGGIIQPSYSATDSRTFVYSPTIIASGDNMTVEELLREDKRRLEQWWRSQQIRDKIDAYA